MDESQEVQVLDGTQKIDEVHGVDIDVQKNATPQVEQVSKAFVAVTVTKYFFFALLSLLLFAFSFWYGGAFLKVDVLDVGDAVVSGDEYRNVIIRALSEDDFEDAAGDGEGEKENIDVKESLVGIVDSDLLIEKVSDSSFSVDVEKGKYWMNYSFTDKSVNLWVSDKMVLIPKYAIFDLDFDGSALRLNVYDGDVYVAFIENKEDVFSKNRVVGIYDESFLNTLLVPRGNQVKISLSKIDSDLEPLLPSKLIKEFKYGAIPASVLESDWVQENILEDFSFVQGLRKDFSLSLSAKFSSDDSVFENTIFSVKEFLTFIPEKEESLILDHLFAYVDDAILHYSRGEGDLAFESLSYFSNIVESIDFDYLGTDSYENRLQSYLDSLILFDVDNSEYDVFKFLIKYSSDDSLKVLDVYWVNIYKGIDSGNSDKARSLSDFYEYFQKALGSDDDKYKQFLLYYNQLLHNLFLHNDVFYRDSYFSLKFDVEKNLLSVYSGKLRDELAQTFVRDKIVLLKRLRKSFFDGLIKIDEAKNIFNHLYKSANDLLEDESGDVAVLDIFEKDLSDVYDFYGYLQASEYHNDFYGSTDKERFDSYLEERRYLPNAQDVYSDLVGDYSDKMTLEDIKKEVEDYFKSNVDISAVEVKLDDSAQRYVKVSATLGGYPFNANFDRDIELLSDVYVYDELLIETNVSLDVLLGLIQDEFADVVNENPDSDLDEDQIAVESTAHRDARIYISKLVLDEGFDVELSDVSIFDLKASVYRVEKVSLSEWEDDLGIAVTFDYSVNEELASHVFLTSPEGPRVMDGVFTLEELFGVLDLEAKYLSGELVEEVAEEFDPDEQISR